MSINPEGAITGIVGGYLGFVFHGFLRGRDGTFIRVDQGSDRLLPVSINPEGAITGTIPDAGFSHGFLLRPRSERK